MRIGLLILLALFIRGKAHLPNLSQVALTIADAGGSTDYKQLWLDLQGDVLTKFAVGSGDRDKMQAAMLLGGKVMSMGVQLPVLQNGLAELCNMVLNLRDEFFSDAVFAEKKRNLLMLKQSGPFAYDHNPMLVRQWFPFTNMHYVCGTDQLPLFAKVAIFKERVASLVFTRFNNLGDYTVLVPSLSVDYSLDQMFEQFQNAKPSNGVDRLEMGILFDVKYETRDKTTLLSSSPITLWLTRIFDKLFPSEYFKVDKDNEYKLVIRPESTYIYVYIGKLIGLSILNSVPIGVRLDKKLLQVLLSVPPLGLQSEVQRVQEGFYSVVSKTAIRGEHDNRINLFTEQELGDVLRGIF